MTGREKDLQNCCAAYLKARGVYYEVTHGGPWERRGRPDLYLCYRGRFIGCELKRDAERGPDPIQQKHLRDIERSGGIGAWITDLSELERLLCCVDSTADSCG